MVVMLNQYVVGLVPLLETGVKQLHWSLTFHQDMLLGQFFPSSSLPFPLTQQ